MCIIELTLCVSVSVKFLREFPIGEDQGSPGSEKGTFYSLRGSISPFVGMGEIGGFAGALSVQPINGQTLEVDERGFDAPAQAATACTLPCGKVPDHGGQPNVAGMRLASHYPITLGGRMASGVRQETGISEA